MDRRRGVVEELLVDEGLDEEVAPGLVVGQLDRRPLRVADAEVDEAGLEGGVVLGDPRSDRRSIGPQDLVVDVLDAPVVVENDRAVGAKGEVSRVGIGVDRLEVDS